MEELLKKLSERMKRIEANQQLILKRLDESVIYPELKDNNSKSKNKNEAAEEIEELVHILLNGSRIQEKFNLAVVPQRHRIKAYLRTGDPEAFKGLKRKV